MAVGLCCHVSAAARPSLTAASTASPLPRSGRPLLLLMVATKSGCSFIPRIEIVARGGRRGHAFGTRAMGPAPPPRKTFAATALEIARAAIDLRLRPGDEGRQAIDADIIRDDRLRLRLKLRLRTMFAMAGVLAGRMLVARLVGLPLTLVVALIVVARHERLLLHRHEAGLLAEMRKIFALVVAVLRGHFILGARLRLVLTELFLGGGDHAEVMFGMLVVTLRR